MSEPLMTPPGPACNHCGVATREAQYNHEGAWFACFADACERKGYFQRFVVYPELVETRRAVTVLLSDVRDYVTVYTVSEDEQGPVTRSDTAAAWDLLKRVAELAPMPVTAREVACDCYDPECGYPHGRNRIGKLAEMRRAVNSAIAMDGAA